MPNYDYVCNECGHQFEYFQSMTDDLLDTCPECNGRVKRLIGSGAGLIFKGSGFYITDYKRNGSSSSNNLSQKKKPDSKKEVKTSTKTSEGKK